VAPFALAARRVPAVLHVAVAQRAATALHVAAVPRAAAAQCVPAVQRVAAALRAFPPLAPCQQPDSAGVPRSPWHARICPRLQSPAGASGKWWEPCADRARPPAPPDWLRAESRPDRRCTKRGCG
jgi:hypothetical protein